MGETNPNPTPVQSLDYRGAPPEGRGRTRLVVLVLVILAAVVAVPLLLVLWFVRSTVSPATVVMTATPAPPVTVAAAPRQAVDYEVQRRTEAYEDYLASAASPGKVVYEEDPVEAGKLLSAQRQQYRQLAGGNLDHPWGSSFQRPVMESNPAGIVGVPPFFENAPADRCVLFVGKLTSPAGNARLVFLEMTVNISGSRLGKKAGGGEAEYEVKTQRKLGYRIFDAAAIAGYPSQLRLGTSLTVKTPTDAIPIRWIDGSLRADRSAGNGVRFYAGVLDPQDPAHCTVHYEYGGQRGTIDVHLTDDDFLRVLPRGGAVSGGTWELAAGPAGAEAIEKPSTHPAP
jgi:hypothetical protein